MHIGHADDNELIAFISKFSPRELEDKIFLIVFISRFSILSDGKSHNILANISTFTESFE
jgi:hypothetical protein